MNTDSLGRAETQSPPARALVSRLSPAAILIALALLWFRPIAWLGGGWWQSHTFWHEPLRALGVVEAWRCGLWDARWFPGFDYGYGYPFLSYYAPLFHLVSGLWTVILGSPTVAVRVNVLCWLLLGTAGMYFAGKETWGFLTGGKARSVHPGLMCAVGWLMSPYLMCQVFVRGSLAEFASCQTLPWVVWGAVGVLGRRERWSRRDWRDLLLAASLIALGVLSHNFIGMFVWVAAAALAPAIILVRQVGLVGQVGQIERVSAWPRLGLWAAALAWALAAAAFYWLPALSERGFVRVNVLKELSYEHWNHYLVSGNFLKVFYWDFGVSFPGPGDEMPLHLGLVGVMALVGALVAAVVLVTSRSGRTVALALGIAVFVALTAIGVALTTRVSAPLWDRIAVLQYGQFPWRLLCLPTVGICLLLPAPVVATWKTDATEHVPPRRLVMVTAWIALVVCFIASHHFYARIKGKEPPALKLDVATWQRDRILTADLDEYGPIWRPTNRQPTVPPGSLMADGPVEVKGVADRRTAVEATIVNRSAQPQPLIVALNYFPAWRACAIPDRMPLVVSPEPATGFIMIENIPSGSSDIRLWFGNTAARRNGKIVSGAAWSLWFVLALTCLILRVAKPAVS